MILSVASFKGGVGKTTTALHLAAILADRGPTLLVDDDPNRSASTVASRGRLPFRVVPETERAKFQDEAEHLVFDTAARAKPAELKDLARASDRFVIPCPPDDPLALVALVDTVQTLAGAPDVRVLFTMCPPPPERDDEAARLELEALGLVVMRSQIRRAKAYKKAAVAGVLVFEADDRRARLAWLDYTAAGRELGL